MTDLVFLSAAVAGGMLLGVVGSVLGFLRRQAGPAH